MNDFASELQALIDKHREFPGADLSAMFQALENAAIIIAGETFNAGPFKHEQKFSGL